MRKFKINISKQVMDILSLLIDTLISFIFFFIPVFLIYSIFWLIKRTFRAIIEGITKMVLNYLKRTEMENNNCSACRNWQPAKEFDIVECQGLGVCFLLNKLKDSENPDLKNTIKIIFMDNLTDEESNLLKRIETKMLLLTGKDFPACNYYESKIINMQKFTKNRISNS